MEKIIHIVEFNAKDTLQLGKKQRFIVINLEKMFKDKKVGLTKDYGLDNEFVRLKNEVEMALTKEGLTPICIKFEISCTGIILEKEKVKE